MNKFFKAALLGGAVLASSQAMANTIQLNFTGASYNAGTDRTTFNYVVELTSNSRTPGQVAVDDITGFYAGSGNFVAASGVTATLYEEALSGNGFGADPSFVNLGTDTAAKTNLFLDVTSNNTGAITLGTLSFESTVNAIEAVKANGVYAMKVSSDDMKLDGTSQFTLTSARGPASNGISTTPLPSAAFAGIPLFGGLLVLGRRRRTV